jgi:urate oxidase
MHLISQNHGKQRVRVMKVLRDGARPEVKELTVGVRLEGDFGASYTSGYNALVVATDTMKNTVQVLAHRHLGLQTEPFALQLARHFLHGYPQVTRVAIETEKRRWSRLSVGGQPHEHSFRAEGYRPVAQVVAGRGGRRRSSWGWRGCSS